MVKNPPSNAGDAGLIPGATGQLSPRATTGEPTRHTRENPARHNKEPVPQLRPDTAKTK